VRRISLDTFDAGGPVDSILTFRELVADYITRYYTDFEPESAWVAESDGKVVGYVMGTVDEKRYDKTMSFTVMPRIVWKGLMQRVLCTKEAWKLVGTVLGGLRAVFTPHNSTMHEYPAHLHINVKDGFRGAHAGKRLIERFEEHVENSTLVGVHARVRGDNESGRKFFERMGYNILFESTPVVLYYRDGSQKKFRLLTYGKKV
jgi:ribosomal protein S18 acetylase RimI-like enzyme